MGWRPGFPSGAWAARKDYSCGTAPDFDRLRIYSCLLRQDTLDVLFSCGRGLRMTGRRQYRPRFTTLQVKTNQRSECRGFPRTDQTSLASENQPALALMPRGSAPGTEWAGPRALRLKRLDLLYFLEDLTAACQVHCNVRHARAIRAAVPVLLVRPKHNNVTGLNHSLAL
jgi:hypothetical protein